MMLNYKLSPFSIVLCCLAMYSIFYSWVAKLLFSSKNKTGVSSKRYCAVLFLMLGIATPVYALIQVGPSISPNNILKNQSSVFSIHLVNTSGAPITNVAFNNTLPAGFIATSITSNTCGGSVTIPSGTNIALSGGNIAGGGSAFCDVVVGIQGISAGTWTDTFPIGSVTATESGSPVNNPALSTATLTVSIPTGITGTKAFSPVFMHGGVGANALSVITITLNNPNSLPLSNASFTDNLPTNPPVTLVVAPVPATSTTCVGGVVSATPGAGSFSFSGGTIPANGSCTIKVTVTPGAYNFANNSNFINEIPIGGVTTLETATNAAVIASAGVLVATGGNVTKVFAPASVTANGVTTSTMTLTLENRNLAQITGASLIDTLPAGMTVATPTTFSTTCVGGSVTADAGTNSVSITGATIPASTGVAAATVGSCTVTANVVTTTVGTLTNSIGAGSYGDPAGTTYPSVSTDLTGTATAVSVVSKVFAPASISPGGTSTLTITFNNSNGTVATLTSAFIDDLTAMGGAPGGFTIGAAGGTTTCGGVLTAAAGTKLISLPVGTTIPAQNAAGMIGSCRITVPVVIDPLTPVSASPYNNVISAGTLVTDKGNNAAATTGGVTVIAPSVAKVFAPTTQASGLTSTLTITLTNPSLTAATITNFTDDLSATMGAGFTVAGSPAPAASSTCVGNNLSAAPGANIITMSAGVIPASGSCIITVRVQIVAGKPIGTYTNSIAIGALQTTQGNNTGAATANLTVGNPSVNSKVFSITPVVQGETSTLTITLNNPGNTAATISSFTDSLLTMDASGKVVVAASPAATSTCVGNDLATWTTAGGTLIKMTSGSIPARGSCTITVPVTFNTNITTGSKTNTIPPGALQTNLGNNTNGRAGDITVNPAYTACTKNFVPASVGVNQTSIMTVTMSNAAGAGAFTGLNFTDLLPAGHTVAAIPALINSCGGTVTGATSGSGTITLSGGALPAGPSSCSVVVNIKAPATTNAGLTNTIHFNNGAPGPHPTTEGYVCPTNGTATLTTVALPTNVILNQSFTPTSINAGVNSNFGIVVDNTQLNHVALTGASFSNTFPAGIVIADTPSPAVSGGCSLGTVTADPFTNIFTVTGATIPDAAICTWTVNVTGYVNGTFVDSIPVNAFSSEQGIRNTNAPTATVIIASNVNLNKYFTPTTIATGDKSILTIEVLNSYSTVRTNATFTDNLPAGVTVAAGPVTNNCTGGTFAPTVGSTSVTLSGATLAATSKCEVTVPVTSSVGGVYNNSMAAGTLTTAEGAVSLDPTSATLTVVGRPTIDKVFGSSSIPVNTNTTLRFTINNPTVAALTNANFTDTLTNMKIAMPGQATITGAGCAQAVGSNFFSLNQTGLLNFTGLTIPASGSCTVTVNITSSVVGDHPNTCTGVISDQTQTAGASCAVKTLTVVGPPTISKAFSVSPIELNGTSTLTFTLTNSNPTTAINLTATSAFNDLFPVSPGQMKVASPVVASTTCTGSTLRNSSNAAIAAGDVGIQLNGGTIAGGASCTVTVNVTADTAGTYNNVSSKLSTSNAGTSALTATASLVVKPGTNVTITKVSNGGVGMFTFTGTNGYAGDSILTVTPGTGVVGTTNTLTTAGVATTLTEIISPGYVLTSATCTGLGAGGTQTPNLVAGTITLDAAATASGSVIACTFTNAKLPTVKVAKISNGGTNTFAFTGNNGYSGDSIVTVTPGIAVAGTALTLSAVSTSTDIIESVPPVGYVLTGISCTGLGSGGVATNDLALRKVTLDAAATAAGSNIVCTFTNSLKPTVKVQKTTIGGFGGPFSFSQTNLASAVADITTIAANTATPLVPTAIDMTTLGADVTLTETVATGYALTSATCTDANTAVTGNVNPVSTLAGNVLTIPASNVIAGAIITCHFSNTLTPVGVPLTITKTTVGGTGTFTFGIVNGASNSSVNITTTIAGTPVSSAAQTLPNLGTAATITETPVAGWAVTSASCTETTTATGVAVTYNGIHAVTLPPIAAGKTYVCNFTNSKTGSTITGTVFKDTGTGATATQVNDGIQNGTETGIAQATVKLTNCGSTIYSTTTTDASGNYSLSTQGVATGTVCIEETNLPSYISTGANVSTGTYDRTTDKITFALTADTSYSGMNFADVPANQFLTDGHNTGMPGTTVSYPHTFIAGSGGTVTFSLPTSTASPVIAGWNEVLYTDTNCDGDLDTSTGETITSASAITVAEGDKICLIQKEFIPSGAPLGASNLAPVKAAFVYTNALPALTASDARQDLTKVTNVALDLKKAVRTLPSVVWKTTNTAKSGETLEYRITYTNNGLTAINNLVLNDATPAYTTFFSALSGSFPANLTACQKITPTAASAIPCADPDTAGGKGGIKWTFTGSLAPGSSGTVFFKVTVD